MVTKYHLTEGDSSVTIQTLYYEYVDNTTIQRTYGENI